MQNSVDLLRSLGFKVKTFDKGQVTMKTYLGLWNCVKSIYKNIQPWKIRRHGKPIFYLDEMWYETYNVVCKGFVDNSKRCKMFIPASG